MKHGMNTKHFCLLIKSVYYVSGPVSSLIGIRSGGPAIESYGGTRKYAEFQFLLFRFWKIIHVRFESWGKFRNESLSKKDTLSSRPNVRTRDLCIVRLSPCHRSHRGSTLTSKHLQCLCVNICLILNPWWIFSPCNMFMCTNKTCFAEVGTRQEHIFRIRISFLSYPCESKKNQNFLSADQTSIPGVTRCFLFLNRIWFLFCYQKFSIV